MNWSHVKSELIILEYLLQSKVLLYVYLSPISSYFLYQGSLYFCAPPWAMLMSVILVSFLCAKSSHTKPNIFRAVATIHSGVEFLLLGLQENIVFHLSLDVLYVVTKVHMNNFKRNFFMKPKIKYFNILYTGPPFQYNL